MTTLLLSTLALDFTTRSVIGEINIFVTMFWTQMSWSINKCGREVNMVIRTDTDLDLQRDSIKELSDLRIEGAPDLNVLRPFRYPMQIVGGVILWNWGLALVECLLLNNPIEGLMRQYRIDGWSSNDGKRFKDDFCGDGMEEA